MKAVVQRVTSSAVAVDGETIGKIGKGYNVLLGVFPDDTKKDAEILAAKIAKLRIFEDEDEKMNMSILDVDGEVLAISQFTLCADIKKGNRPSFTTAAKPDYANELYEYFMEQLKSLPCVKEIRGLGLLIGVEFEKPIAFEVKHRAVENKLLITAVRDSIIRMAPPLIVTKEHCDEAIKLLKKSVEEALQEQS